MEFSIKNRCLEILHARTPDDYKRQLISYVKSLGLSTISATVVTDHSETLTEFQSITNAPRGFLDDYYDLEKSRRDPVSQHCKRKSEPIIWNRETYISAGLPELWEFQAPHGYKFGVAVAMHFHRGRHFMLGADGDIPIFKDHRHATSIVKEFVKFTAHAQAVAFELTGPNSKQQEDNTLLTGRELEALRWTMDGKTAKGVAAAMFTSEEVAVIRLTQAISKLGCSSKYEAALKAIRLGLIKCQ
jgi:DNA-binding CsgD family transcriptional regulator